MRVPVQRLLNAVLALIYPECCQICRQARATPSEGFVCSACRADSRFIEPPFCRRCGLPFSGQIDSDFECSNCLGMTWHFESARSAVYAKGVVLDVIHRYKYKQQLWFEPFLADLLISRACGSSVVAQPVTGGSFSMGVLSPGDWDWLLPIPLHPMKQREREFNQAERLARRLSVASGIPLKTNILKRIVATRTQTRLSREERAENVRKAFALNDKEDVAGKRLVLVDDVLTTGATTNACAHVLRRGGAASVCVWTVARGT